MWKAILDIYKFNLKLLWAYVRRDSFAKQQYVQALFEARERFVLAALNRFRA